MSSADDKVEELIGNVNEIKVLADVIQSQCITISKLLSATQAARRGMDVLVKENHSQREIIARLENERDCALFKILQTLEYSQPEAGVLSDMSRKLDELWEESKKRRT
jgi:hypothetical protein